MPDEERGGPGPRRNGSAPTVVIVGAGPGIGAATARRFAREGYRVGLVARDARRLGALVDELRDMGVEAAFSLADVRRPVDLHVALRELVQRLGGPDVVLVSALPDVALIKSVLETGPADLVDSFTLTVGGAAAVVGEVVPAMRARKSGVLLFTTGSAALSPSHERAASGITTTAATVYFQMLHEALAPEQIHVSHTAIVGAVGADGSHTPEAVANHLLERVNLKDEATTILR